MVGELQIRPIFLYTKAAKVPSAHLKALRDAGVIPVQVESLDQAKIVDAEHQLSGGVLLSAAIRAMAAHSCTGQSHNFVKLLSAQLEKD